MLITSTDNEKIKYIEKLKQKKYRDSEGLFLVETLNIIKEAYKNHLLKEVYVLEGTSIDIDVPIYEVSENVMNKIKQVETSKVVGICKKFDSDEIVGNKVLLLDGVQDPGNIGTIIRSAVAFDIDTVVLSNTSVDLYNDKVIRSSEGNIFNVNIIRRDIKELIKELKEDGYVIYSTTVNGQGDFDDDEKIALVIGNEGNGVSKEVLELCDKNITIKMNEKCESLNASVCASILMYKMRDLK